MIDSECTSAFKKVYDKIEPHVTPHNFAFCFHVQEKDDAKQS